jgi:hypothetical protein
MFWVLPVDSVEELNSSLKIWWHKIQKPNYEDKTGT